MKKTLLEIVQDILSDMSDDEVNSITDTLESLQVAQIIKSTYEELIAGKDWPHLRQLFTLASSGDSSKPTHMGLSESVKKLEFIRYNTKKLGETRTKYNDVEYLEPDPFLRKTNDRNTDNSDVLEITDYSGVKLLIKTDKAPEWWTSFDDENIVFDSHDIAVDTTLQASKTQCMGFILPAFSLQDTFTPDLPAEAFPLLIAESKSACFARLKDSPDPKSEQQATRQKNWLSRNAWQAKGGIGLPDYGRRPKKASGGRERLNDKRKGW